MTSTDGRRWSEIYGPWKETPRKRRDRGERSPARGIEVEETSKDMTLRPGPDVLEFSGGSENLPLDELSANTNPMSTTRLSGASKDDEEHEGFRILPHREQPLPSNLFDNEPPE